MKKGRGREGGRGGKEGGKEGGGEGGREGGEGGEGVRVYDVHRTMQSAEAMVTYSKYDEMTDLTRSTCKCTINSLIAGADSNYTHSLEDLRIRCTMSTQAV